MSGKNVSEFIILQNVERDGKVMAGTIDDLGMNSRDFPYSYRDRRDGKEIRNDKAKFGQSTVQSARGRASTAIAYNIINYRINRQFGGNGMTPSRNRSITTL